jgi:hypothetical protein
MKSLITVLVLVLVSCAHKSEVSSERVPAQAVVAPNPERTIWSLRELAQQGKFAELNELFNNEGIVLEKLPQGYAAGAATRVLATGGPVGALLESITGATWKGKMFFPSENPRRSQGLNRIRNGILGFGSITPMASFVTELVDHDSLVPEAKTPQVILNYAKPVTKRYWQEAALEQIQVYDVMVPVQGKYGPVFIGKTWLGNYDKSGAFKANTPDQLIAWFFLDFNEEALKVQKAEHWDGSKENILNPLPSVK